MTARKLHGLIISGHRSPKKNQTIGASGQCALRFLGPAMRGFLHFWRRHFRRVACSLNLSVSVDGTRGYTMDVSMTRKQTAALSITPKNAEGQAAPVSDIKWSASPDTSGALTASADSMSATFVPSVDGTVTIAVAASNALGDVITAMSVMTVATNVAVTLGLTAAVA